MKDRPTQREGSGLEFVALLAPNGTLLEGDRRFLEGLGFRARFGESISSCPGGWTAASRAALQHAVATAAGGRVVRCRLQLESGSDATEDRLAVIRPLYGSQGEIHRLAFTLQTSPSVRTAERALAESERRFQATFEHAPIGIAHVRPDGSWLLVNEELCRIVGYTWEELKQLRFQDITHPEDLQQDLELARELLAGKIHSYRLEKRYFRKDGSILWVELTVALVHDASGRPDYFVAIIEDISERKKSEARQEFLVGEITHRAKNLLAVIQSMIQLTRADSVEDHVQRLSGRLQALSRAQSLLAESGWEGVDLLELAERQLQPFEGRVAISGGPFVLLPQPAQAIAIVLHELATNAAKYGALSVPEGVVALSWRMSQDSESVNLRWYEFGGPPVQRPEKRGFGTALVEQSVEMQLGGAAVFDWRPEGLECSISLPRSNFSQIADPAGTSPKYDDSGERRERRRVLLVEDHALLALQLSHILEGQGYRVVGPVSDEADALALARDMEIDAAILDVDLHGKISFATAEVLKARGVPFIFASGHDHRLFSGRGERASLQKPLQEQSLLRTLAGLFR